MEDPSRSNMFQGASWRLFQFAWRMRYAPTMAEAELWNALANKKLGVKFRRQHPLGPFILDFYCHQKRLAIEVDGGYHLNQNQMQHDAKRTNFLRNRGIKEIRFSNEEVIEDISLVLEKITEVLLE
ncbi:MAG: endonuclease domain-containing protein [Haliscomenobacter sp.]|nr:endonuclease domain-containing protein [Haliscomenobacter sp.]MBK7475705.1 endonuclease domain-containing protein [Haliscomenobacter sp.]MBK8880260.1 endonuclease domain-containing protein [Haliscomenobacter sp.]